MQRYVAFLRAINVGGHTVKMDRLRGLFEEMGLENVATFIASGNVIFESTLEAPVLERQISAHLREALGYSVDTFLRTPSELAVVATHPPFTPEEVAGAPALYVGFLPEAVSGQAASAVAAVSTPTQVLRIHGRELYWLCHTRLSESDVSQSAVDRALGMPSTMRNVNTVRRILARVGG